MEIRKFGSKIVLRCDKSEEIVETIKKVCQDHHVKLASVTGIGAVGKAVVGLFEPNTKEYHSKEFNKSMEIIALSGNVSQMNQEVYLHLHATLSDSSYNAFGGHLTSAWVSCTAEIIIDIIEGEVDRQFSDEIGLNLIAFK